MTNCKQAFSDFNDEYDKLNDDIFELIDRIAGPENTCD